MHKINIENPSENYENIYLDKLENIKEVYIRFEENLEEMEQTESKETPHAIQSSDQLYVVYIER